MSTSYGGNPNPYVYPLDPINGSDLTGNCWGCSWVKHHWKAAVHLAVGVAVASLAVAAAGALCGTGVGCIVVAGMLSLTYGTAAQLGTAAALHEHVTARKAIGWMGSSAFSGGRNAAVVSRYGATPARLAFNWARRMF